MPFGFFSKKKEKSLGIDIGTSSIKVVELSRSSGDKIELTNYGEFSAGAEETFQSPTVRLSSSQAAETVKQVLKEAQIDAASATMSVPAFSGFSTVISLPDMPDAELEQAATYEAKKYIPLPLTEVQFEWVKIGKSSGQRSAQTRLASAPRRKEGTSPSGQGEGESSRIGLGEGGTFPRGGASGRETEEGIAGGAGRLLQNSTETRPGGILDEAAGDDQEIAGLTETSRERGLEKAVDLLIVAVTNELISKYYEIAKLSEIRLKYLELDSFSLSRSLVPSQQGNTLIIDIGSQGTLLIIVVNGWPVFTRTTDIAGLEFSKALAGFLGIDFARAEKLKEERGLEAGGGTLLPLVDSIVVEGKRMMDEFTAKKTGPVQKVVLSGGTALMPGLLEYVRKSTGRETVLGFPFDGIIYPKALEQILRERGPSFSVAAGLALREFR